MKDLTKDNIYKTFILFAVPIVLTGIMSQGYNIIDTIIAGKLLGDKGLAATGATSAIITFVVAIFWGYGTGASIYTANLFGAKDYEGIKKSVYNNLGIVIVLSVLLSIIFIALTPEIMRIFKVDETIRHDAEIYFTVYMAGFFAIVFSSCCAFIMHAFGMSSYPFWMSVISSLLNVAGNILSVAVLGMGVMGIALSTVISALVVCVCYIFKLKRCFCEMHTDKLKVKFDIDTIKFSAKYAIPSMAQQMIMYLASVIISPLVNAIGSAATASYTVVMQLYSFNANIYQNSAKTVSNYTAQCMGAGKREQLKKGLRVGLMQGIIFLMPSLIVCVAFAKNICSMFFPSGYAGESLTYSIMFAYFYLPFIIINLINNLFHSFYRGTGSMKLLVSLTGVSSVVRIIFTALLVKKMGMDGVFLGWVISWAAEAVFALLSYFTGLWKKDTIAQK